MDEKAVKQAVRELDKSGDARYEKSFSIKDKPDEVFTVTIVRKKRAMIAEDISMEARANTISALPSGPACGCCGGSGRS